ncbi:MAG: hypothetical protein N3B13_10130 [Deltaproteobacteria bacterium]|nr:hypothetical protein [Deltaproteobacteria bacterium]
MPKKSLFVLIFTIIPAISFAFSVISGEPLGKSKDAIHFDLGYPDVSFLYDTGYEADSNLGLKLRLGYGPLSHINRRECVNDEKCQADVWFFLGARYIKELRHKGKLHLALRLEPGFLLVAKEAKGAGFMLSPGIIFSIPLKEPVIINFGFNAPFHIYFYKDGVFAGIPVAFTAGSEIKVDTQTNITVQLEAGPSVGIAEGSDTSVYILFKIGMGIGL